MKSVKKFPLWTYTVSVLLAALISRYYVEHANLTLSNFNDRTIGVAVLIGKDLASRPYIYLHSLILFCISYLVSNSIFKLMWTKALKHLEKNVIQSDSFRIFTFSLLAIFMSVYHYMNGAVLIVSISEILKILAFLSLLLFWSKTSLYRIDKHFTVLAGNAHLVSASFIAPLVVFFVRWAITDGSYVFTNQYQKYYVLLWISYWVAIRLASSITSKKNLNGWINSLLAGFIPIFLIPLAIVLSNEVQFALLDVSNLSLRQYSLLATAIPTLMALALFLLVKNKVGGFDYSGRVYFPILLVTIALFRFHVNHIDINFIDSFHHGENLIPAQQLYAFGKLPFVDIYPTHGLSYPLAQILYIGVNGYEPFAAWAWEGVAKVVELIFFYWAFSKITSPIFAVTVIMFLPIIGVFGGQSLVYGYIKSMPTTYYLSSFGVGLLLARLISSPTSRNMALLTIANLFMCLWRIDFGIASIMTTGLVLVTTIFYKYPNGHTRLKYAQVFLSSFLTVLLVSGALVLLFYVATDKDLLSTIALIVQFVKFQGQAQALPNIIPSFSPTVIFQYFILPATAIYYNLKFFSDLRAKPFRLPSRKIILVFIACFSLIIFVRAFQRQTLAVVGYNPYLFAFLLISLPLYIARKRKEISFLLFILMLFGYQLALPNAVLLLKTDKQITTHEWRVGETRVNLNVKDYYKLVEFLNSNLGENQTFLDLTSSPILYILSNREFIGYFIPNAYHTSEIIQMDMVKRISVAHRQGKLPIVIFKQPNPDANSIDNVPNEIRNYRIYEFVYSNFDPAGNFEGYSIWVSKNHKLVNSNGLTAVGKIKQDFILGKIPFIWANFDNVKNNLPAITLLKILNSPVTLMANEKREIMVDKNFDKSNAKYLYFKIKSKSDGKLKLSYGQKDPAHLTFDLVGSDDALNYLVRISSQHTWVSEEIEQIILSPTNNIEITNIEIESGD